MARSNAPWPPIPPQPLGTQFSYIVGCGNLGGAQITIPEGGRVENWAEAAQPNPPVHGCLRIDAYSAPDIEGVNTDEGVRISWIPATALPRRAPTPPARPCSR